MLGRKAQSSVLEATVTVTRPYFEWKAGSYGIEDILKTHELPVVVQCDTSNSSLKLTNVNFDLAQPLLLYRKRENATNIVASGVTYDKLTKTFIQVGEPILIPKEYAGWFAVLGDPDMNIDKTAVPYFRLVKQLADSKCTKLLIGGSKSVDAFEIRRGKEVFCPRKLNPGDVLNKVDIYEQVQKRNTNWPLLKGKLTTKKFLICVDENGRECFLPYETRGEFYQVAGDSPSFETPILQMDHIADTIKNPCLVKLLYGNVPTTPCLFTEFIILDECYTESTVIFSTVLNLKNVLLELHVNLELKFKVAIDTGNLLTNPGYISAMTLCKEMADEYSRSMKVFHHLTTTHKFDTDQSAFSEEEVIQTGEDPSIQVLKLDSVDTIDPYYCTCTPLNDTSIQQVSYEPLHMLGSIPDTRDKTDSPYVSMCSPFIAQKKFNEKSVNCEEQTLNVAITTNSGSKNSAIKTEPSSSEAATKSRNNSLSSSGYTIHDPDVRRCISIVSEMISDIDNPIHYETKTDRCGLKPRTPITCVTQTEKLSPRADLESRVVEDDLPVGAESSSLGTRQFSMGADSGFDSGGVIQDSVCLSSLSVCELCGLLKQIGIDKNLISQMKEECVDGRLLQELDEEALVETFPQIRKIDLKRISMFVSYGWRPKL